MEEKSYIYIRKRPLPPPERTKTRQTMKRLILFAAALLAAGTLAAQNCIIVDSEKIFKSIDAYNQAISDLDDLAKQYQEQVDNRFQEVETLYNNYQYQKASLSSAARQARENTILAKEKEAQEYQESLFDISYV